MGIIGFGDLGRKLRALITPFHNSVAVYDPWLPDDLIRSYDCTPVGLDDLLQTSRVVFLFASVTTENQGFIGKREFELMQPGAAFLLMSRAAVVDFPELVRQVKSGRIVAATDVFPKEPVDPGDPDGGWVAVVGASHGRDDRGVASDRAYDRRRRGTDFAWAATPAMPARRSRSRWPPAQRASGNEMKRGADVEPDS